MVMQQGMLLAVCGLGAGLVASFGAERLLNAMFSSSDTDWAAYALVAPTLLAITLVAAYVPARRASRTDPVRALRYE